MSDSIRVRMLHIVKGETTADEILQHVRDHYTLHGNDLDLLTRASMFIQAGLYDEATRLAVRVFPNSAGSEEAVFPADMQSAQAAFIAARIRAQPLYEQAAVELEGTAEGSQTMAIYYRSLEMLKTDPNW